MRNVYFTENGKKLVQEQDGLRVILTVLKKSIALKNAEGASFLRNVAAGSLLNFLVDQEALHEEVRNYIFSRVCHGWMNKIINDDVAKARRVGNNCNR